MGDPIPAVAPNRLNKSLWWLVGVLRSPPWWRHQMETFSALLAHCAGNSPVPVNSPHKGQWRGSLMFSLIYAWINDWVNNRWAGNLRRHRGHCDVIVMSLYCMGVLDAGLGSNPIPAKWRQFVSHRSETFSLCQCTIQIKWLPNQNQLPGTCINNYIPQYFVGCNYSPMS